jgi:Uma2 family endonuclease
MPDILLPPESSPHAILWTRDDCAKMEAAGVLNYRYELVEGVVIKVGQNMPHGALIMLILEWVVEAFMRACVVTQVSIDVRPEDNPTNEPMPDVLVLTRPAMSFTERATPPDIRLLIEAADTTVRYDLTTKASLYARAGIVEYWVVSLPDRKLTVHRDPQQGAYRDLRTYREHEQVTPLAAPDKPVVVARLLPATESQTAV